MPNSRMAGFIVILMYAIWSWLCNRGFSVCLSLCCLSASMLQPVKLPASAVPQRFFFGCLSEIWPNPE